MWIRYYKVVATAVWGGRFRRDRSACSWQSVFSVTNACGGLARRGGGPTTSRCHISHTESCQRASPSRAAPISKGQGSRVDVIPSRNGLCSSDGYFSFQLWFITPLNGSTVLISSADVGLTNWTVLLAVREKCFLNNKIFLSPICLVLCFFNDNTNEGCSK